MFFLLFIFFLRLLFLQGSKSLFFATKWIDFTMGHRWKSELDLEQARTILERFSQTFKRYAESFTYDKRCKIMNRAPSGSQARSHWGTGWGQHSYGRWVTLLRPPRDRPAKKAAELKYRTRKRTRGTPSGTDHGPTGGRDWGSKIEAACRNYGPERREGPDDDGRLSGRAQNRQPRHEATWSGAAATSGRQRREHGLQYNAIQSGDWWCESAASPYVFRIIHVKKCQLGHLIALPENIVLKETY